MNGLENKYLQWQGWLQRKKIIRLFFVATAVYSPLLLIVVGVVSMFSAAGRLQILPATVALIISRGILVPVLVYLFPQKRPYVKYNFVLLSQSHFFYWGKQGENSFPSGHTASLAAIGMSLFYFHPWLGIICLLLSLMAGFSRIILGFHYPKDVFFGFLIGLFSGFAAHFLWKLW